MDVYWSEVWQFILSILGVVWGYLQTVLTSPTIIAAIIAPWAAITIFLRQQRISRVQRIYYEESLLEQLNHLNRAVAITNENFAYFENAVNLILIDLRIFSNNIFSPGSGFTQFAVSSLREIAKEIKAPVMYQSSKKEIIITLFKKYGYVIHKWLFKFDNDFRVFNLHVREVISALSGKIDSNNFQDRMRIDVRGQAREINNLYSLLMRHQTLIYLFNRIVSRIGILDFKSSESLINNVMKDIEINDSLKKFDEVFKILFGYYKLEENFLISYLTDENKNKFKLQIDNKNVLIERIKYTDMLDDNKLKIVMDDILLSGVKVNLGGVQRKYALVQTGIANLFAFHEKPMFYPEIRSLTDMMKEEVK